MIDSRAQSPLDFAIAMGIFLVAVTFVFTFIPSLTAPFVEGNQDRSANTRLDTNSTAAMTASSVYICPRTVTTPVPS